MTRAAAKKSPSTIHHLPVLGAESSDDVARTLHGATSHDLVFAVVGHLGAGASTIADDLARALGKHRRPCRIKLSELIGNTAIALDPQRQPHIQSLNKMERTIALQEAGTWLRKTRGPAFTAGLAIHKMYEERQSRGEPLIFIIDSLKNKSEVEALRKVYGRAFYLISVVCSPDTRKTRLQTGKLKANFDEDPDQLDAIIARDEYEDDAHGQQVRETIQLGDFFVDNEKAKNHSDEKKPIIEALQRFLHAVFGTDVVRPTRAERGMHAAWTASLRSSCLSRQVGAAILSGEGLILSTGTNDVPKGGGGLYEAGISPDHRCFVDPGEGKGYCRNDRTKNKIYREIIQKLKAAGAVREAFSDEDLLNALKKTAIRDLIEFSRAVHAEMDAIISLARTGTAIPEGTTLYCTTYPCHNCARHIVASGIREVVFIEPYPKSRAAELHADSICETPDPPAAGASLVHFRQFTGVAPRRFSALFEKRAKLKDNHGDLTLYAEDDGVHLNPVFKKSHLEFEQHIADHIKSVVNPVPKSPEPK